jgi:hypothetical protein
MCTLVGRGGGCPCRRPCRSGAAAVALVPVCRHYSGAEPTRVPPRVLGSVGCPLQQVDLSRRPSVRPRRGGSGTQSVGAAEGVPDQPVKRDVVAGLPPLDDQQEDPGILDQPVRHVLDPRVPPAAQSPSAQDAAGDPSPATGLPGCVHIALPGTCRRTSGSVGPNGGRGDGLIGRSPLRRYVAAGVRGIERCPHPRVPADRISGRQPS